MFLYISGVVLLIAWLVFTCLSLPGLRNSVSLQRSTHPGAIAPCSAQDSRRPRVTVILAARNEAKHVSLTLQSLRRQTWGNLQVIAINDRSTDETGWILSEMAKTWSALDVIHIESLPPDWLGKPYALYTAAKSATGEWLLFTDADVVFSEDAIEVAMDYAVTERADHLALAPAIIASGFWLRAAVYFFLYNVVLAFRPQNASNPHSGASVGIGAFNLVRKTVYETIHGHQSVALRTDEDLALGRVIKKAGFKQVFAGGTNLLKVEWYPNLKAMMVGLEKNSLAPFQYRFGRFAIAMLAMLVLYDGAVLGTFAAASLANGSVVLFGTALLLEVYLFHMTRRYSGVSFWWSLSPPLAAPILGWILMRAAALCYARGGVQWRGTFYSLADLRKKEGHP